MRWAAGAVCPTCLNAGWVKDGYELARCPTCDGASAVERSSTNAYAAFLARDRQVIAATRQRMGQPPIGHESVGASHGKPGAPPEGFAQSGVPVPTTVTEEQRDRARARLASDMAAVAAKLKVPA